LRTRSVRPDFMKPASFSSALARPHRAPSYKRFGRERGSLGIIEYVEESNLVSSVGKKEA
jgi:hypothetical protein